MVNTFVTFSTFSDAARSLDSLRLNKQIVEAYQVLHLLEDIRAIQRILLKSSPRPKTKVLGRGVVASKDIEQYVSEFLSYCKWSTEIRKTYLAGEKRLLYRYEDNKYTIISKEKAKSLSSSKGVKSPDRIVSLGFSQHPIVKMWQCYEDGLKVYINMMIREWTSRRKKNGEFNSTKIPIYEIEDESKVALPWWTRCVHIHKSHRASLLRKERQNEEAPWYVKRFKATMHSQDYMSNGYIWLSKVKKENLVAMMKGQEIELSDVCDKPTTEVFVQE